jgi:hypothetical protein
MAGGREVRSRTFRWRELTIREHGASNIDVAQKVAEWLSDKRMCFTTVEHVDAQTVNLAYGPSFTDRDREILLENIKKEWPKCKVGFYGEETVVILRGAVCLDEHIQGSAS